MPNDIEITPIERLLTLADQCRKGENNPQSKLLFVPLRNGFDVMVSSPNQHQLCFLSVDIPKEVADALTPFCISGFHFAGVRHSQEERRITPDPAATSLRLQVSPDGFDNAHVMQNNKPRFELTLLPCDEKLLSAYTELKAASDSGYEKTTADALALAFSALKNRAPNADEVTVLSNDSDIHITYRIGHFTSSFSQPAKGVNIPRLHLNQASLKALFRQFEKGQKPLVEQHGNQILFTTPDETFQFSQHPGSLKIESTAKQDSDGHKIFVDRYFLTWRLRDIKQQKDKLSDRYVYFHLTQEALFIATQNKYLRSNEKLAYLGKGKFKTGTLRFDVADIGDLQAGFNKRGADDKSIGINLISNDDGSLTLELFENINQDERMVHMSCRCVWDNEAFETLSSTIESWDESMQPVPHKGEQQVLF